MKKLLTSHFTHNLSFNENVDTPSRVVNSDFQIHQSVALNGFSWPFLICRFSVIEKNYIILMHCSFYFVRMLQRPWRITDQNGDEAPKCGW